MTSEPEGEDCHGEIDRVDEVGHFSNSQTLFFALASRPRKRRMTSEPEGEDCHGEIDRVDEVGHFSNSQTIRRTKANENKVMNPMTKFYYVYILTDTATGTHHYTGCTENLQERLAKHNAGDVPHTSKFKPWRIETAIAFSSREKAYAFEAYLKTHCGRAFSHRHF